MDVKQLKDVAQKYTPEQIEGCITQQVDTGKNICLKDENSEKIIDDLSQAAIVRELTDKGMGLADAIRELARRMRFLQSGFKE